MDLKEDKDIIYASGYAYTRVRDRFRNVLKSSKETIDNAKPSEALKELEDIAYVADVLKVNHKIGNRDIANQEIKEMVDRLNYRIPIIKQALLKTQEQEKVLSTLFEKRIDLESFYTSFIEGNYNYNFYNIHYGTYGLECLTEEEFDLLKRYLEWKKKLA